MQRKYAWTARKQYGHERPKSGARAGATERLRQKFMSIVTTGETHTIFSPLRILPRAL